MLSTIKIDFAESLNGDNSFRPVIRVSLRDSDDVRDKLMKDFFQSLGGESEWLVVNFGKIVTKENFYKGSSSTGDLIVGRDIEIYPVKPDELKDISKRITAILYPEPEYKRMQEEIKKEFIGFEEDEKFNV